MRKSLCIALPLAVLLAMPAAAQENSSDSQNPQAQAQALPGASQDQPADLPTATGQPLKMETHEGFWGKINPFARKKYVQRQLAPVNNRVNELDELTAANAQNISDLDARTQQGIQMASAKASEAYQHALDAGNRAQAAQQTASQASTRLQTVEQVVSNIDQYKQVTQMEVRLRPGQTALSQKAMDALDQMTSSLKDQKGYIFEIQGFAAGRGEEAIETSQRMADAVRRYLVIHDDVPVYRVHVLGMGNSPLPASDSTAEGKTQRVHGAVIEVSMLKNDLEQLSSAQPIATPTANSASGSAVVPSAPSQQPPQSRP